MDIAESLESGIEIEGASESRLILIPVDAIQASDALKIRRQQGIDELERETPSRKAHILLAVGKHHVIDAELTLDGAGLAPRDAGADPGLEFESDMLCHMPEPGSLLETPHESSPLMEAAAMFAQTGQEGEKPFGKVRQAIGWPLLQSTEIELDPDHWGEAVQVRPAIDPALDHTHGACCRLGSKDLGAGSVLLIRQLARRFRRAILSLTIIAHFGELLTTKDQAGFAIPKAASVSVSADD
jgi:hypothetical protein